MLLSYKLWSVRILRNHVAAPSLLLNKKEGSPSPWVLTRRFSSQKAKFELFLLSGPNYPSHHFVFETMEPAARGDGVLIRRNNNRLSGINQKLLGIGRQHQFSWEKVQGRNVYMSEELVHNRLIVNSTVLAMDLITVFVRQEFNSLVQPMFLNFNEVGRYLNDLWRYVMNKFNQFLDYFFNRSVFCPYLLVTLVLE